MAFQFTYSVPVIRPWGISFSFQGWWLLYIKSFGSIRLLKLVFNLNLIRAVYKSSRNYCRCCVHLQNKACNDVYTRGASIKYKYLLLSQWNCIIPTAVVWKMCTVKIILIKYSAGFKCAQTCFMLFIKCTSEFVWRGPAQWQRSFETHNLNGCAALVGSIKITARSARDVYKRQDKYSPDLILFTNKYTTHNNM